LKGSDRSFSTHTFHPELGASSNDPRTWPGNIRIPRKTGGFDILNLNFPACTSDSFPLQGGCRFNVSEASDLLPSSRQLGFFGMGTLRLSAQTDAYAELLASSSRVGHEDAPTAVSTTASLRGTPFVLPSSSPYYPTGVTLPSNWSLAYRTVPLGPATTEVESNNVRLVVGLKSRQWDWDLDGAVATNRTWSRERYVSGMVDAGRLSSAFKTGLLNPFGPSGSEGDALLAASECAAFPRVLGSDPVCRPARDPRADCALPVDRSGWRLGVEARAKPRRRQDADRLRCAQRHLPQHRSRIASCAGQLRRDSSRPLLAKGFEIRPQGASTTSDFGTLAARSSRCASSRRVACCCAPRRPRLQGTVAAGSTPSGRTASSNWRSSA
jgi:iron complex outermembrane receptor protein